MSQQNIQESHEPQLCRKCEGIGSIWIYNKEEICSHCMGNGVEPVKEPQKIITFASLK